MDQESGPQTDPLHDHEHAQGSHNPARVLDAPVTPSGGEVSYKHGRAHKAVRARGTSENRCPMRPVWHTRTLAYVSNIKGISWGLRDRNLIKCRKGATPNVPARSKDPIVPDGAENRDF